jgi:Na+/melibiose symporter-like transporter
MTKQNLSVREKLGFGLGDMASNIVYQAISTPTFTGSLRQLPVC